MTTIASAADENFVVHASWVQCRTPGMRVIDRDGLVLVDSGLACDTFNFVLRARLDAAAAADRVREAINFFQEVRRPFSWWFGPADEPSNLSELLIRAGLERAETELAMAANLDEIPAVDLSPQGLRIERVTTPSQLRDFARLNAANWIPPDLLVERFYELGETALLSAEAPLWLYVAYLDDEAVATSEATIAGGVVGLYNISTRADARRRGFGTAMTVRPMIDARAVGLRRAILQAAPEGVNVYRRVGFATFGEITEYKPPKRRSDGQTEPRSGPHAVALPTGRAVTQRIAHVAILVRDYDEAIRFYADTLGFELVEDTDLGNDKRWVRVRPPGSSGTSLLLARAATPEQLARVGDQTGGRVFVFIETDDFQRDYARLSAAGVKFVRPPRIEPYGTVAVFEDLYGNRIDLIQPTQHRSP